MDNKPFPFKKMFWAYTFAYVPFATLAGLLALFDVIPVGFNGKDTYGCKACLIIILYTPFFSIIFSGFTWVALNFGNWVHNGFLQLISKQPID